MCAPAARIVAISIARARHDLDPLRQHPLDDVGREALQQRDALAQRRLEGDLAAHGALGDRGDLGAQADLGRQLVDAFLLDHGGIHVGDEELLAAECPPARRSRRSAGRRSAARGARERLPASPSKGMSQASPGESQSGAPALRRTASSARRARSTSARASGAFAFGGDER